MYTKKIYFSGDLDALQKIFTDVIKVTSGQISAQNVISYVNPAPRNVENISGVEVEFNPKKIDVSTLLDTLFENLNPYAENNLGVYYSSGEDAPQVELHMNFVANKGKQQVSSSAALTINDPNSKPNRKCYVNFGRLKNFQAVGSRN